MDLAEVAGQAIDQVHAEAESKGVRIRGEQKPAVVQGNGVLLERIALNLVQNAVRYNVPEDGWVEVTTDVQHGQAVLVVSNTGPVVPAYDPDSPVPPGTRDKLKELGPEGFCRWILEQKRVLVTDTTFRDAHQSLLATRLRTNDMATVAPSVARHLSGLFSLGGQPDHLIVEYCVQFDPIFDNVSYKGVPDIRIIVFLGYPVMAMIRLPTRLSDGKANLHQGAIGVGIDIPTGKTKRGVWGTEIIRDHPDTEHTIVGLSIPHWHNLLQMASRCYELSGLGYVGVDFVLDRDKGPLILELNARPGLAIQVAHRIGLLSRLKLIESLPEEAILGNRRWDLLPRIAGDEGSAGLPAPVAFPTVSVGT